MYRKREIYIYKYKYTVECANGMSEDPDWHHKFIVCFCFLSYDFDYWKGLEGLYYERSLILSDLEPSLSSLSRDLDDYWPYFDLCLTFVWSGIWPHFDLCLIWHVTSLWLWFGLVCDLTLTLFVWVGCLFVWLLFYVALVCLYFDFVCLFALICNLAWDHFLLCLLVFLICLPV